MISINTHDAKTRLSELLATMERTQESIVICRNGKPVAEVLPWKKHKDPFKANPRLKKVIIREDPTNPLSNDDWPARWR